MRSPLASKTKSRESACGELPLAVPPPGISWIEFECVRCFHCGDGTAPVGATLVSPRNSRPEKSRAPMKLRRGKGGEEDPADHRPHRLYSGRSDRPQSKDECFPVRQGGA